MPTYSFKRDTRVYLVYNGLKYRLHTYSDLSFSQTFTEEAVKNKTIHSNLNFDNAVIVKASPANFSFSIPLVPEHSIVMELLVGYDQQYSNLNAFDIYAQTDLDTYKINGSVLENGNFIISKEAILGVTLSGTGKRLQRVGNGSYSIPGTLQPSPSTNYTVTNSMSVMLNFVELDYITDVYLELRNNVEWTSNDTVQASLVVTEASNTIYPEDFVVNGRTLSGAITQNVTSGTATTPQSWSTYSHIYIRIGRGVSEYALQLLAPEVVFTNRMDVTDVYTQVYDFRMASDLEPAQ